MMKAFRDQAERFGTRFVRDDVVDVDFSNRPLTIRSHDETAEAHAVILATGARANWLGLPNEKRLAESGGGVSACAVCDGAMPIYRNQELVVVGGGDSAIEEGTYLTRFARKVYVVHRRDQLRASKAMQDRFLKHVEAGKMEPIWDTVVIDVLGDKSITGVRIRNVKTNKQQDLACKGLFLAIGHTPNTELFKKHVACDDKGYIKLKEPGRTYTSVEGVFAAGDVADHVYRQAVTAAGSGCMAALDAERWLAAEGIE
jgi:thioredoxin reductase (NADPH)